MRNLDCGLRIVKSRRSASARLSTFNFQLSTGHRPIMALPDLIVERKGFGGEKKKGLRPRGEKPKALVIKLEKVSAMGGGNLNPVDHHGPDNRRGGGPAVDHRPARRGRGRRARAPWRTALAAAAFLGLWV